MFRWRGISWSRKLGALPLPACGERVGVRGSPSTQESLTHSWGATRAGKRLLASLSLWRGYRHELEAAAFRRLVEHLRKRTDVQNLDLMNLAGFCRNCLSNWMKDAADARGVPMSKDESREAIYGMPYDEWKAKHQQEASKDQQAAFQKAGHKH